jgi:hypothetical protein
MANDRTTRDEPISGWAVGGITFAACILTLIGAFEVIVARLGTGAPRASLPAASTAAAIAHPERAGGGGAGRSSEGSGAADVQQLARPGAVALRPL